MEQSNKSNRLNTFNEFNQHNELKEVRQFKGIYLSVSPRRILGINGEDDNYFSENFQNWIQVLLRPLLPKQIKSYINTFYFYLYTPSIQNIQKKYRLNVKNLDIIQNANQQNKIESRITLDQLLIQNVLKLNDFNLVLNDNNWKSNFTLNLEENSFDFIKNILLCLAPKTNSFMKLPNIKLKCQINYKDFIIKTNMSYTNQSQLENINISNELIEIKTDEVTLTDEFIIKQTDLFIKKPNLNIQFDSPIFYDPKIIKENQKILKQEYRISINNLNLYLFDKSCMKVDDFYISTFGRYGAKKISVQDIGEFQKVQFFIQNDYLSINVDDCKIQTLQNIEKWVECLSQIPNILPIKQNGRMNMLNTIKIDFINCKYKEINLRLPTFTYNYQHSVRNFSQTFTRWILKQMTRGKININSFRRMFK